MAYPVTPRMPRRSLRCTLAVALATIGLGAAAAPALADGDAEATSSQGDGWAYMQGDSTLCASDEHLVIEDYHDNSEYTWVAVYKEVNGFWSLHTTRQTTLTWWRQCIDGIAEDTMVYIRVCEARSDGTKFNCVNSNVARM